jgi:hypothetical protein
LPANKCISKVTAKRIKKSQKRIFAIPAKVTAKPVNPKRAATKARIKNNATYINIETPSLFFYNIKKGGGQSKNF